MRFSARIVSIFLGILLLLPITYSLLPVPAFALGLQQGMLVPTGATSADVPQNTPAIAQGVLLGMLSFASCLVSGRDVVSPQGKCLGYNSQTGKLDYVPSSDGGVLGLASSGIAILYSPPKFHVGTYLGYLGNNFGLAKNANAAGPDGFTQLTPVLKLWIAFRNIAYLLFVIVFVVVGFAIMLRAKIDPRTVMTIENQIPKIIVALILVSFSYAIAGFVIDIMWLTTFVTINLFASLDPQIQGAQATQNISQNLLPFLNSIAPGAGPGSPFGGGILSLIMQPANAVYDVMVPIVKQVIDGNNLLAIPGVIPCFLQGLGDFVHTLSNPGAILGSIGTAGGFILGSLGNAAFHTTGNVGANPADALGQCIQDGTISWIAGIAGLVAFLIFAFALMFALFRMFFTLLKSYALFLIYAILGPMFIMMGVLPGSKVNFEDWLRHLLAYSLVFPFGIGIILMGRTISDVYTTTSTGYIPPLLGAGQNVVAPIGPIVGFAIMLLLPQALTMLQDTLKAPDIKYLPGIGQMLAGGTKAYSTIVGKPWERYTRRANTLEGKSEGILRKFALGGKDSFRRHLLGDTGGGKTP